MRTLGFASVVVWVVVLCAACGGGGGGGGDGGAGGDGGGPSDAGMMRDGGMTGCTVGQHMCGGGCISDLDNLPANGCRLGCSEPCPTPDFAMATCAADGHCDFECVPPATRDLGICSCTVMTCEAQGLECGTQTDGCGTPIECGTCAGGGACVDGRCGCTADSAEVNDSRSSAHSLGRWDDSDGTMMTFDAFSVSSATDEDWYALDIVDGTDSSNPDIDVTLYGIPAGSNYDLQVWFVCNESTEDVTCDAGMPDAMIGAGCASASTGATSETVRLATNCTGIFTTDDSGTAYVRVTPTTWSGTCAPYTLDIHVH